MLRRSIERVTVFAFFKRQPTPAADTETGGRTLRLRPVRRGLATAGIVALLPWPSAALLGAPAAFAAEATAASFGGTGTYVDPLTKNVYAALGSTIQLNVTTSADTKCVDVTLSTSSKQTQTSGKAKTNWTFDVPVTSTDAVTATASASPTFNNNGTCTGSTSGNARTSSSVIVDGTGPVVSGTRTPAANAAGWNNRDVSIGWTAIDAGSGVKTGPTPASDSVTTDTAGVTKVSSATDNVGNTGSGSVSVKLDKTSPSISGSRTPAANAAGWNNTDVTTSFVCSDALSGIRACPRTSTVSAEGADQSVPGEAVDAADNKSAATVTNINIDKTRPSLSGAPTTSANGGGWYDGDVTIGWSASDALSGLAGAAPPNATITGEGTGLVANASVTDRAGNTTNADSARVNIDRTAPATSATAPTGWTNKAQTVTLAATDALSGVKETYYVLDGGEPRTGTSVDVRGDGKHTLEYWSVDKAGNAEAHKDIDVKIDGTNPTIRHTLAPQPNDHGWNSSDVTVRFSCDDSLSGIASCSSDQVVAEEGLARSIKGTATDTAGNAVDGTAVVNLDKTKPTLQAAADRAPNSNGWYRGDVTVGFSCSDALSGIDGCTPARTLGEGEDQSADGTAKDTAGNTAAAGVQGINIDKTRPLLSGAAATSPNGDGWYQGDVRIDWTGSDALSGLAGSAPEASTISGEGEGLTAETTVADKAGNSTTRSSSAVNIDRTAPTTSIEVAEVPPSGWYAGPVTVTLQTTDNLSGVAATHFAVDGGTPQVYDPADKPVLGKGEHTIRAWGVDKAGNEEPRTATSVTVKVDGITPTITGSRTPAANAFGWSNTAVDVSFACKDDESGIASCSGVQTFDQEGEGQSASGDATDNAGNTSSTEVEGISVDLTRPTLVGTPTTRDNAAGWYRGDVKVRWTPADGLSGVDPSTVPADDLITGEGRGLKAGPREVKDRAGNSSGPTESATVNIDRTAPEVTATRSPRPNAAGWNRTAVTTTFACSDALSAVAECPGPVVRDQDGRNLVAQGTALDHAGNERTASVTGINIDSEPPKTDGNIVCTAANGHCRGTMATVELRPSDPGATASTVKEVRYRVNDGVEQTATTFPVDVPVPLSGSGTATVSFWAEDVAGNTETPAEVEVKYDTIAPVVTHDTPGNAAGWSNSDISVQFRAEDDSDGSGLDKASAVCGPTPLASEGTTILDPTSAERLLCTTGQTTETDPTGRVLKAQVDDRAGNTGFDHQLVKVDKTKPTLSTAITGTKGNNGWYITPVKVAVRCADPNGANGVAGSGVATCPAAEQVLSNGSTPAFSLQSEDRADNRSATSTVGPFDVDTDAPLVTVNGVADGKVYRLGEVPAGSCSAADGANGSGVDGACSFTTTGGTSSGVGTFTYTAKATDKAGHVMTVTGSYSVVYRYDGVLQPINDTAHTKTGGVSVFKAGSTVPVKFRLMKADGSTVRASALPAWLAPSQGGAVTSLPNEELYTASATEGGVFKYDATSQQYSYNWNTARSQAGKSYRIGFKLDDGRSYSVVIGLN